jgi:hypothetical protein
MNRRMLGIVLGFVMSASAFAGTPNAEILAPIHKFIDSFNKGDAASAAATKK